MTGVAELRALTALRGIAAWLVVLYHIRLSIAGLPPAAERVLAKGYLAVDFFFLLSGFVIWLAWHKRFADAGWRAVPGFLTKRIARIWPLHLFVLAGALALAILLAATGRADPAEFPFGELPLHIALIQNWGLTDRLAWNDPAWSISVELAAYLAFPLLATAIDWRRLPTVAVLAAGVGALALLHGLMARAGVANLGTDIPRWGLLRCLCEFAAGTTIAALWLRWRGEGAWPVAGAAGAAVTAGVAWAAGAPETAVVPAMFAALLLIAALTAQMPGNPLAGRWLHRLGEVSYATYLGHFLLWFAFKLAFVDDPYAVAWPLVALYLAMVLASSVLLYRLVERPAQAWINTRLLTVPRILPA